MDLQRSDYLKAIAFGLVIICTSVLVALDKVSSDTFKSLVLILAPSPLFSFEKKGGSDEAGK
jgi:hypothetical protein